MKTIFKEQVDLLLDIIGYTIIPDKLALKGGTAINLFFNDMPRLSVDIDLTYLPLNNRSEAADDLNNIVDTIVNNIKKTNKKTICKVKITKDGFPNKIQVMRNEVEIKVEINNVFRGTVYPPITVKLCDKAQELFNKYIKIQSSSFEDIYAGKFCAALDRQHPRDLFDVMVFFNKYDFTENLKNAFIVYLLSSSRPTVELISPNYINQEDVYKKEFLGMVDQQVHYYELEETRIKLVDLIHKKLSNKDKEFLISFESGTPEWSLCPIQNMEAFPSIRWKLINLQKLDSIKKQLLVRKLAESFN